MTKNDQGGSRLHKLEMNRDSEYAPPQPQLNKIISCRGLREEGGFHRLNKASYHGDSRTIRKSSKSCLDDGKTSCWSDGLTMGSGVHGVERPLTCYQAEE